MAGLGAAETVVGKWSLSPFLAMHNLGQFFLDVRGALPHNLRPMYELADFGDPWEYWSVHASQDRSKAEAKRHRVSHLSLGASEWP